jgi:hypothetical protein
VHNLAGKGDPADQCFAAGRESPRPQESVKGRVERARGEKSEHVSLADRQGSRVAVAEPPPGFDQCVENRLQIEGRATDDLEHVAGRGLVFERLVALGSAFGKLPLQIG